MQSQNHPEYQYLNLLKDIKKNGSDKKLFFTPEVLADYAKKEQEPPCIRSVFGRQIRFDLSKGFPLLTTKKVFIRGIIIELLWFLRGDTNIKFLVDNNVHIWDEWAYKRYRKFNSRSSASGSKEAELRALNSAQAQFNSELRAQAQFNSELRAQLDVLSQEEFIEKIKNSPADSEFVKTWGDLICVYGKMWRKWPASDGREIDQLGWCIQGLKDKPFRKSYVVSAWNPDFIYAMASHGNANEVPPFCHTTFQFQVTGDNTLNLGLYQRSADVFLGVPFNIASYALLLLMVAQITGLKPGEFVHTFGDVHIYSNHFDAVNEQLSREPKPFPTMKLNPKIKNIDDFKYEDFILENYNPHPAIKAEIANIGGF